LTSEAKTVKKMSMAITLDQFYTEFQQFVKLEAKRWEANEKRWDINEKRWEANEKRWEVNEKRWTINDTKWQAIEKRMRKMDKKIDELFNYLDKEIMVDRRRIDNLERSTKSSVVV